MNLFWFAHAFHFFRFKTKTLKGELLKIKDKTFI